MRYPASLLCFVLGATAPAALAGAFSVAPLGAELGAKTKAASFTVANAGKESLSFQVSVRKWTQDVQGNDLYEDTPDLVVFPRQLDVPAGGKRIVRVGIEGPAPASEAAYRVFIEELPPAASASQGRKGTVAVVGRFGLPVFIVPPGAKGKLTIDSADVKGGKMYSVKLANTGASRVRLASVATGSKDSEATLASPYLLAGTRKEISGPLGAACKPGATVKVVATADGGQKAEKELVLPPDACRG